MRLWSRVRDRLSTMLQQADGQRQPDGSRARRVQATLHPPAVPLLAIAPAGSDRRAFEDMAARAGWEPVAIDSHREAVALLNERAFPVVVYDRDLAGGDWREVLRSIISSRHPACVILASRVIDTYLWEEVIQNGGFDVLPKPFREEQVLRVLRFALSHWRTGWIRRRWDDFWER